MSGYLGIKPMAEEVAAINRFYDQERRTTMLALGLVVGTSVLAVIFVSYFILNILIRRRITLPVERLASSTERIMEGDLDVDIQIHEGGDFAVLERALKEMLESIRRMFAVALKSD
ncbi:MAG: HAMP domain-containing protein [Actinomycetota bacterium]